MFGDGTVYLVDMRGEVVHTRNLPYRPGAYGYLLDNGHLFYPGKVMKDLERFEAWRRFKGGAALEVDWHGNVLWEVNHPDHHHDARKLKKLTSPTSQTRQHWAPRVLPASSQQFGASRGSRLGQARAGSNPG